MATYIVQAPKWTKAIVSLLLGRIGRLHLYTNDYTPGRPDDTTALFTEATATGYAYADVGSGWSLPALDVASVAFSDHADFVFTVTADSTPQYVYGWYMTDSDGDLIFSQRGEGEGFPFRFYLTGDKVTVRIRLTQESYGPPPPPAP